MAQNSQSVRKPWHRVWSPCHVTTPQHELPTARALHLRGVAADVAAPVTRLNPHLCASPSSYFNAYHMADRSFPALHPLASFSSFPDSLVTAKPVSSSIQPALQPCNSMDRLQFFAAHLSRTIFIFAPIALHRTAPLCLSALAISPDICCQANCLTCTLQFEGYPQKQGGISRCNFSAADPTSPFSWRSTCKVLQRKP